MTKRLQVYILSWSHAVLGIGKKGALQLLDTEGWHEHLDSQK